MAVEKLSRGSIVLLAYLAVACGSEDDSGKADDAGSQTLDSDPFTCGVVATVQGGLEHAFGREVGCGGGVIGTTLTEVVGPVAANGSVPMVTLNFEFDPAPVEGQTGPLNVSWVSLRQQVPNPADALSTTMLFEWSAGPGACSMNLESSAHNPAAEPLVSDWLWISAEGSCSQALAPVPPNTKPPVTLSPFAINSYTWPVE